MTDSRSIRQMRRPALLGCLFLAAGLSAWPQSHSFSTLDVPGASLTYADAINNIGQVAGSFNDASGPHGFVATHGQVTRIDPPYGPLNTNLFGIGMNDLGQIVGQASVTDSNGRIVGSTGFLESFGRFLPVNAPNADLTQPLGINDEGQIIGLFVDASGTTHGFLKTLDAYTIIQNPNASGASIPFGINNFGQIVGWFDEGAATHGFLYANGSFTTIENPAAPDATFATGINDLGQIVGFYIDGSGFHGFLDTNGVFTNLDDPLAGGGGTFAYAINDLGDIVGQFGNHSFQARPGFSQPTVPGPVSSLTGMPTNSKPPVWIANLIRLLHSGK